MGQIGLTILRVVVGLVFVAHGWRKVMVGFDQVSQSFANLGIPAPLPAAVLAMLAELVGGALVLIGLKTRLAAIPPMIVMVVATVVAHLPHGFFLPKGYEYTLVLLAALVTLILSGPGPASVDALLKRRKEQERAAGEEKPPDSAADDSTSGGET